MSQETSRIKAVFVDQLEDLVNARVDRLTADDESNIAPALAKLFIAKEGKKFFDKVEKTQKDELKSSVPDAEYPAPGDSAMPFVGKHLGLNVKVNKPAKRLDEKLLREQLKERFDIDDDVVDDVLAASKKENAPATIIEAVAV